MLIGVTAGISKSQYFINQAYVEYVKEAGLEPVLLTIDNDVNRMATVCDGLLLPGGGDIEPTHYGENNVGSNSVDPYKDEFEREALMAFLLLGKPVFGICRGMQLIMREFMHQFRKNDDVWNMFDYYQHIGGHNLTRERDIARFIPSHKVLYNPKVLYGEENTKPKTMFVNSIHHQAVICSPKKDKQPVVTVDDNNSMAVVSLTDFSKPAKMKGSIVEGVDGFFHGAPVRAVQWHPEEMRDVDLLTTFFGVEEAAEENDGEN